jgi:puromycin-sensitive aminopeptidase
VSSEADFRLPRTVVPNHYSITMRPDLESFTFRGSEVIEIDVHEAVSEVVLNSLDLVIDFGELVQLESGRRIAIDVDYDLAAERAVLLLAEAAGAGPWQLHLSFSGKLNDKLHGFYQSRYVDDSGQTKYLATTQFESTHAREAIPCWDEPDIKATFGVTLIVPEGLTAISNQPEKAREQRHDGHVIVTFMDTMVMPVYLLTFIVGELESTEPIDVDGIPLRIVYTPGKGNLTSFATEAAVHGLQYFADYYGIAYPGDKLDMIAIPDFAWGAMENLGAITYRESDLLVDPSRATNAEVERVAAVVSHELAHMWFGDLVTMRWWDGVWLNEAFATFMEVKCTDHFRPEWNTWLYFGADRSAAMEIDALTTTRPIEFPVASPIEANAMFDVLTYDKGSSVLRMLEQYIGENVFRDGVRAYLREHAYSNTVTDDLWQALEAASGEPIGAMMHSWIYQGGLPHVRIHHAQHGYRLTQEHFRYLGIGDGSWSVPLLYRTDEGEGRLLLMDPIEIEATGPFIGNAGGHGFYRIKYEAELLATFTRDMSGLAAAERYGFVKDVWASVLAGDTPLGAFFDLASTLREEREPMVWNALLPSLNEIRHVAAVEDRPILETYIRGLAAPAADLLGWQATVGESDRMRQWRGDMLRAMGVMGSDAHTIAKARAVVHRSAGNDDSIDADVDAAALAIVAANGTMVDFDNFVKRFVTADTPQIANRFRRALTTIPYPKAAARTFDMLLDGSIRRQDGVGTLALLLGHRDTGSASWERVMANWEAVVDALDTGNMRRMLDFIYFRSEPEVAADIKSWLETHDLAGEGRHIAQQLERLEIRVGLRAQVVEELAAVLG